MTRSFKLFFALHDRLMIELDTRLEIMEGIQDNRTDEQIIRKVENDFAIQEIIEKLKTL